MNPAQNPAKIDESTIFRVPKKSKLGLVIAIILFAAAGVIACFYLYFYLNKPIEFEEPALVTQVIPDGVAVPTDDDDVPVVDAPLTSVQLEEQQAVVKLSAMGIELDAERSNHEKTKVELEGSRASERLARNEIVSLKNELRTAKEVADANASAISTVGLQRIALAMQNSDLRAEIKRLSAQASQSTSPEAGVSEKEIVPPADLESVVAQETLAIIPPAVSEPEPVPEVPPAPKFEFMPVYVKGVNQTPRQSSDRPWKRIEVKAGVPSRPFSVPKEIAKGELRISKIRGVSMRLREVGLASRASDPAVVPETSDGVGLEKTIGTVWFLWNPVDESDKGPLIIEFR